MNQSRTQKKQEIEVLRKGVRGEEEIGKTTPINSDKGETRHGGLKKKEEPRGNMWETMRENEDFVDISMN